VVLVVISKMDIELLDLMDDDDPELFSEWSKEDFEKELQKYSKVRNSDFQMPQDKPSTSISTNSQPITNHVTLKSSTSTNSSNLTETNKIQSETPTKLKNETQKDFWSELEIFLQKCYSPTDTEKVVKEFKRRHVAYLDSLSLDNIEKLCEKVASVFMKDTT